ncbi:hypothetical protein, partial [Streptomyces bobili]|uniref:hypothetical protein n=1 Tax=Streptomyces bobili TaxID=67280 RepID=UPI001ABFAD0B
MARFGDVAAGLEPVEHRGQVLDQGYEAAGDGSCGAGDGGRDGHHLDLLSGAAAHHVGHLRMLTGRSQPMSIRSP